MKVKGMFLRMAVAAVLSCAVCSGTLSPLQEGFRQVTNFPNPFDSRVEKTTIQYTLEADSDVAVRIYDLFGNIVREFHFGFTGRGTNRLVWDGTNEAGEKVAKGGYIVVMEIANSERTVLASRKVGVIH